MESVLTFATLIKTELGKTRKKTATDWKKKIKILKKKFTTSKKDWMKYGGKDFVLLILFDVKTPDIIDYGKNNRQKKNSERISAEK